MTLTLKNNEKIDLRRIREVQVRKSLALTMKGGLSVWGWNVVAIKEHGGKIAIRSYQADEQKKAIALCSLLNRTKIFTNSN